MKRNARPGQAEQKDVNQYVYIDFVGIKSCGKPVCIDVVDCDKSPSAGWKETYFCFGVWL